MEKERWYADGRVWLCLVLLLLCGLAEAIVGLPFRLLDGLWNLLF